MTEMLYAAATVIIPMVLAIVFHEVAHGWTALALGDSTAAEQKRLSLNPLRHVDPFGTIILPGFLKLVGAPVFGWAKPVPVDFSRLRNPRTGMMLVAAAGPGTNLVLALIGAVILGLVLRPYGPQGDLGSVTAFIVANLANFLLINVFLALFNLLPIPPFDGSHIVQGLLPERLGEYYGRMQAVGLLVVLFLIVVLPTFVPSLDIIGRVVVPPVQWLTGHYFALAAAVAGF
ncbi:MAG: site-2 protease family protein [Novosphingobium sp.]